MNKRTRTTLLIVALVLALLAGAVYLRKNAPPEAARLLPESDGIVYLNLRPLRAATHFDQHPVQHDAQYQKFLDAAGFQWDRDLEEAAFALHRMADPRGPNGIVAYSYVLVGKFDGKRLAAYLDSNAAQKENYSGHLVYSIPNEGRTVRVTQLGYDMVALSNTPTAEQIHSILDRYRTAALPFAGSTLLSQHYEEVPLLSLAWGIGKIGLPLGDKGGVSLMGLEIPLLADTTFIASVRWAGALKLRIEEITPSEGAAAASTESLQAMLGVLRAVTSNAPETEENADTRALLQSAAVEQKKNRLILTATLPQRLLQDLVASPESERPGTAPAGESAASPASTK